MEAPKVTISASAMRLMANSDFILTKNEIIEKVCAVFGQMGNEFQLRSGTLANSFPEIFTPHPKIAKGEKLEGMPWVMLDYPRGFDQQGHLAIRVLFWWGNYFSIQLQASGNYFQPFVQQLPAWQIMQPDEWITGITTNPWNLQLPNLEWRPIGGAENNPLPSPEEVNGCYLKVAKKIPLSEWDILPEKLLAYFQQLLALTQLVLSHPGGEIAP